MPTLTRCWLKACEGRWHDARVGSRRDPAGGTWQVQDWRYGKQLADQGEAHQKTLAGIASAAAEASEKSRKTEQERQRVIDQVRTDAANQKQKDDATAAEQRADNDSLREQAVCR